MKNNQICMFLNGRSLLLIMLFWLFFSSLFAQKSIKIGVKIMPELADVRYVNGLDSKLSLSGGLQGIYYFNKNIGLETGIYYQNRGFQQKSLYKTYNGNYNIVKDGYHFLSFPLLFRAKLKSFYVSVGLSYDVYFLYYLITHRKRYYRFNSDKSKFNLSTLGSLGYEKKILPKVTAYLELRYSLTLSSFPGEQGGSFRFYNYGIGIGMHYDIKR